MLSSLLRPRRARYNHLLRGQSPFADESTPILDHKDKIRHAAADWTDTDDYEDSNHRDDGDDDDDHDDHEDRDDHDPSSNNAHDQGPSIADDNDDDDIDDYHHEDGGKASPILPIFSAPHLGMILEAKSKKPC